MACIPRRVLGAPGARALGQSGGATDSRARLAMGARDIARRGTQYALARMLAPKSAKKEILLL
jgi:hypothetical protein